MLVTLPLISAGERRRWPLLGSGWQNRSAPGFAQQYCSFWLRFVHPTCWLRSAEILCRRLDSRRHYPQSPHNQTV